MKRKLTTGKVKTTPQTVPGTTKPDNISKKVAIKAVKRVKQPRAGLPNLRFTESKAAQNDEAQMRKEDRIRKGL